MNEVFEQAEICFEIFVVVQTTVQPRRTPQCADLDPVRSVASHALLPQLDIMAAHLAT